MWNTTSYRPTNEDCLMRSVTFSNFCSPCLESLWLHLLEKVDLIDNITTTTSLSKSQLRVSVSLVPFGASAGVYQNLQLASLLSTPHFTSKASSSASPEYDITWARNGTVLKSFGGLTTIELDDWKAEDEGTLRVDVTLRTPEVKLDPEGRLSATRTV